MHLMLPLAMAKTAVDTSSTTSRIKMSNLFEFGSTMNEVNKQAPSKAGPRQPQLQDRSIADRFQHTLVIVASICVNDANATSAHWQRRKDAATGTATAMAVVVVVAAAVWAHSVARTRLC